MSILCQLAVLRLLGWVPGLVAATWNLIAATRPPHGQPVTLAAAPRAAPATELLQLCERFFTTASPTVIAELHTFLVAEGVHPATALGWFTDSLAFATYHPEPGE